MKKGIIDTIGFASPTLAKKPLKCSDGMIYYDNTNDCYDTYSKYVRLYKLIAYTYIYIYSINITILRFFKIYEIWSRLDIARIFYSSTAPNGRVAKVFNNCQRSKYFIYINGIVDGIIKGIKIC